MSRTKDSIKHQLRVAGLDGIADNDTKRSYRKALDAFALWAKDKGIRDIGDITADTIQDYERHLEERPEEYSAATIHTKLAPVCRATGISMRLIRKPKRKSNTIKRGRTETKTGRGEKEMEQERYKRLITLQQCAGIRRAELAKLKGSDLIREGKQLFILVRSGKGGKEQRQWILPEDRETVEQIFEGIAPDERVFTDEEMGNHINLHKLRASHAQRCYRYYCEILENRPDKAAQLRAVLLKRWEQGHAELLRTDPRRYQYARSKFIKSMDDRPVMLRGENKEKAIKLGLPVVYDRLALMATSIMHLSHWRVDVTLINYMIT